MVNNFNAGDDGILIIKGERLEVNQNNQKYRAENTLSKFRNFYNATHHLGYNIQRCSTLDEENRIGLLLSMRTEDLKDCNTDFVRLFNSFQDRKDIYDGRNYGGIGMNTPIFWIEKVASNTFFGYSKQENNFNDKNKRQGGPHQQCPNHQHLQHFFFFANLTRLKTPGRCLFWK